ncbi:MAG TPA: 3-hydroxybutyrate dehydrogenase [Candidatus Dormibacteraeota bacterium]|jgi:3-hydroxybutyrate dehydrogenase|nr:3-hydroxybutyrate dehydrogenase [Candidatus Dormibacteraeota bacterium]
MAQSTNGHHHAADLGGRRALVTGAASGIGLAVARHLGALGARVVLSDLEGPRLEAAAAGVPGALAIGADLSDRAAVHRLADEVGEVDILVNNAGLQHVSPIEEFDEARWDLIVGVMLTAPFVLTKRLLPGMYARGWGRVVNIASVHGLIASPYKAAYVSAKHGLLGFTKTLALEAGAHGGGVSAHAICPSYVRTPLVEGQVAAQATAHGIPESEVVDKVLLTQNAVRRLIEPEEVARAVEFLCSDLGWTMTGGVLAMDAGWLAH